MNSARLIIPCAILALTPLIMAENQTDNVAAQQKPAQTANRQKSTPYLDEFWHSINEQERDALKKLQKDNPREFEKQMREMLEKYKAEVTRNKKNIDDLIIKYRAAKTDEEKKLYLGQIRQETEKEFYRRLNISKQRLIEMQRRLENLRSFYNRREKNAETIISNRIKYLISDKYPVPGHSAK